MIGDIIKALREEKKISQSKLGEMLGVSRQTIYNWEIGKNSPTADKIEMMCKIFNVPASRFYDEEKPSEGDPSALSEETAVASADLIEDLRNARYNFRRRLKKAGSFSIIVSLTIISVVLVIFLIFLGIRVFSSIKNNNNLKEPIYHLEETS